MVSYTIQECRERDCVHVSSIYNRRNCGVVNCSSYEGFYEKRWYEEESWEFEGYVDEEE